MARWRRRLAYLALGIVVLWALGWLAVPPLLKWQLQLRGSALLGRALTVESVAFQPWNLELTLSGIALAAASGGEPTLRVARVRGNLSASSLLRLAPVVERLEVDDLQLRVARLAAGRYDIDDLIQRFTPGADAPADAQPARFALYNLAVRNAQARFDDQPVGRVHVIDALQLTLPFISSLPAQVEVKVEPHLAFRLNGAPFDSGASATPFAQTRHGSLELKVDGLDVQPYLGYLPQALPVRLQRGRVSGRLALEFTQPTGAAPSVALRGTAAVADLALATAQGEPLLAWRELQLGLADVQPLTGRLAFGALRLSGAQLHLARDAAGRFTALQGAAPAAAAAEPASAPASGAVAGAPASRWRVSVADLELADARVLWHDAAVQPAAALMLDAVSLQAKQVAWPVAAPVPLRLAATLRPQGEGAPAAGQLTLEGTATDSEAKLNATLTALSLDALAPYAAQTLTPRVQGRVSAQAVLHWAAAPNAPRLTLDLPHATLDAFQLLPAGARRALDAAGGVQVAQLALADVQLDIPQRTLVLGQARLNQPAVALVRDAQGRLNAAQWLRTPAAPARGTVPPRPDAAEPLPAPWHVTLQQFALERGQLRWTDAAAAAGSDAPLRVDVDGLRVDAQRLEWHGDRTVKPGRVRLSARIAGAATRDGKEAGTVQWAGDVGVQPLQASGELRVTRLPVHAFEPYFAAQLPLAVLRAEAGYRGRVAVRQLPAGLRVAVRGDMLLGDVHVDAPGARARVAGGADELLSWQSFAVNGIEFALEPGARPTLNIGEAVLSDFYARLVVTEQGRFNLQAGAPAAAASAPAAAAAAVQPAAAPVAAASSAPAAPAAGDGPAWPLDLRVAGTQLVNGRVDFSDYFVRPNYSAALTDLNGKLGALSSTSRDMATLELRGRVAGTGLLQIGGQINPAVRPPAMDIKASATDLELAPLSPYAGKYAGYAIQRGKLSVEVAYKIAADGRLDASNQVVLNQLTFGERIESPDATKLPVLLAVALLTDRHGVIDVNLPVSGSLNDPQFSIGGIVVKLIVNLLVKALTAPFALLAGGGSEDLSLVEFAPGTATITAAGLQTIDKVAKALSERPALKMTVTGASDAAAERQAFQRAVLEARLQAERRREDLRAGTAASAPAAALAGVERSRVLKALYRRTDLPNKPRNVIGLAKDIPDAEMEALLLAQAIATPDAMRELALQRGLSVRDALIGKGLPSERLFVAAPKVAGAAAAAASAPAPGAAAAAGAPAKAAHAQLSLAVN